MLPIDRVKRNYRKLRRDPNLFVTDFLAKRVRSLRTKDSENNKRLNEIADNCENLTKKIVSRSFPKDSVATNARKNEFMEKTLLETESEIYDYVNSYPVNSLKIKEEYIWPYLRSHLLVDLYSTWMKRDQFRNLNPRSVNTWYYKNLPLEFRDRMKYEFGAKDYNNVRDLKADFLFFVQNNGFGRVEIDGNEYHRLFDPIYEAAIEHGISSKKIEILQGARNFEFLNRWYKLKNKTQMILAPDYEKLGISSQIELSQSFFTEYKNNLVSLNVPSLQEVKNVLDFELHSKEWLKELLMQINPKVIFLAAYHYWAPLISAANELGIITVDIQHGLYGKEGVLYHNHYEIPFNGYQAYPDIFAVWSRNEYDVIKRNFQRGSKHVPELVGNKWLDYIQKLPETLSHETSNLIDDNKIKILIILRDQNTFPKVYTKLITETKHNVQWVVRHHPTKRKTFLKSEISDIHDILVSDEIDNIKFNELFNHIDLTLSEGSTLALEASYFGIRSIVVGDLGKSVFNDEIERSEVYYVESTNDFDNLIDSINPKSRVDTLKRFASIEYGTLFKNLLTRVDSAEGIDARFESRNQYKLKKQVSDLESIIEQLDFLVASKKIDNAIDLFLEIRVLLEELTSYLDGRVLDEFYSIEGRQVQSYINQSFRGKSKAVFISDSLQLSRVQFSKNTSDLDIAICLCNEALKSKKCMIELFAQRYFTTDKALTYWDSLFSDIADKHVFIHLGLIEGYQRVLLERHRLALRLLSKRHKNIVNGFSNNLSELIIEKLDIKEEVSYEQFINNINKIHINVIAGRGASLNLIGFPYAENQDNDNFEAINQRSKKINKYYANFAAKNKKVNYISVKALQKKASGRLLLDDNIHLTRLGRQELATKIASQVVSGKV